METLNAEHASHAYLNATDGVETRTYICESSRTARRYKAINNDLYLTWVIGVGLQIFLEVIQIILDVGHIFLPIHITRPGKSKQVGS